MGGGGRWYTGPMPILRRAILALFWALPSGAIVLQTKLPAALPVVAAPVAPAELAAQLLTGAAVALPQAPLPGLAPLVAAAPVRSAALKPVEPVIAARAVALALPILQSAAPLSAMDPAQSAVLLSTLFDRFESEGLLNEPAPVTALSEAAASTGLDAAQLDSMAKHSGGLVSVEKFLRSEPLPKGGYLLGTTHRSVYSTFAAATGLTHFAEVYQELFGRVLLDATDRFLDFITGTGDRIVFLVPPKALEHPGVTNAELLWFLEHPERMANVRFVLGAYEFLGGEPEDEQRGAIERALELWRGKLTRAPDERRIEQRRRHRAHRGEPEPLRPEGAERLAFINRFIDDMTHAYYGKDRGSSGRFFFQGSHGTSILHRSERGLFLEFSAPGGGWAEIFVSKRGEPELYQRLWLAYRNAS